MFKSFNRLGFVLASTSLPVTFSFCLAQGNIWTKKTGMPTSRYFFSTGVVNNRIYAIGGSSGGTDNTLSLVEEYDPSIDTSAINSKMPIKRYFSKSNCMVNDKIYAIGGAAWMDALETFEIYDPVKD